MQTGCYNHTAMGENRHMAVVFLTQFVKEIAYTTAEHRETFSSRGGQMQEIICTNPSA